MSLQKSYLQENKNILVQIDEAFSLEDSQPYYFDVESADQVVRENIKYEFTLGEAVASVNVKRYSSSDKAKKVFSILKKELVSGRPDLESVSFGERSYCYPINIAEGVKDSNCHLLTKIRF